MDIQYHNYAAWNVRVEKPFTMVKEKSASASSPPVLCIRDVWNINYWDKLWVLFFPKMLMLYKHIRESCRTINRTGLEVSISSCTDLWPLICVCMWGNGGEISCSECVSVCVVSCSWEEGWVLWWQADESEGVYKDGPWSCCPAHASIVQ